MESLLRQFLTQDTETEILEFKEAKTQYDKDKLGKYFSALSNEANLKNRPNAWFILGVDDKKQIVGTEISEAKINDYKKEVSDHTSPNMTFREVHKVQIDGKTVLLCEIPAAPKGIPVSWKRQYFGRDGESLGILSLDEIDRIREQSNSFDWSTQIIEEATLDDLSPVAIEVAKQKYSEKNPHIKDEILNWETLTFLNKARITIQGKITNTAILLLGKPESEHFISPATATISWILKDKDGLEKDYQHFTCPLILSVQSVYAKIRNLNYRYLQEGSIFPQEVSQFDPYIIREALNNCVAHQDYTIAGKINVVEREDGILIFSNSGNFIPGTVEKVIDSDSPETKYRNPFLANAMVDLKMIDTIGSGIRKMFLIQKNKYFPLPDYDFSGQKVTVKITGKISDLNYARKLAQMPGLSLHEIMLLDKVSKGKPLKKQEIQQLRAKKLIEGRKPNLHVSAIVASATDERGDYIKMKGFKDDYYKNLILGYLEKYGEAEKEDIDKLLFDLLPNVLDEKQKNNKIRNLMNSLSKKENQIENKGTNRKPVWIKSLSN
ncbi:putative DNA binding domain-containing protein [Algoriphagus sp. C2-6-M1]|uniref:RNA-binding domain-containing protein n=1 Tax=Algoriphagus persicinus TaxID=3108754 RepID=UPI002B39CD08|nr:RNA-binding domain-containing protein [Algoriphagus sp. C2-6-M1]MEB2780761.1 putative DNA binding domain-containing protein [Algoriphagus sp. C2-6-M1]